jgi:hypothetical protein
MVRDYTRLTFAETKALTVAFFGDSVAAGVGRGATARAGALSLVGLGGGRWALIGRPTTAVAYVWADYFSWAFLKRRSNRDGRCSPRQMEYVH